jgi:hypothetical protein
MADQFAFKVLPVAAAVFVSERLVEYCFVSELD